MVDRLRCAMVGACLAAGTGWADTYMFTVDPARSGMAVSVHNGVRIEGVLMGNYDEETNPGGTQTREGLFGGSGNEPIAYTTDASVDGDAQTSPAGGFTITLDFEQGLVTVNGLSLDLLNGAAPTLPLTVALDFDTFRTIDPNSLYLGGILPPIEVGEAILSQLSAVQSGPGGGILTPAGEDSYTFGAVVTAGVTLALSVLDQDVAPPPLEAGLALAGTITINGDGTATVSMSLEQEFSQVIPLEDVGFEDVPLDLPTILPPGETANLVLDGTVEEVTLDMAFSISVEASGEEVCLADFDGNGVLDLFDFLGFQNAFAKEEPAGDFNGDGAYDLFDFLAYLNAFDAGC